MRNAKRDVSLQYLALTAILSNNNSSMVPSIAHGLNEIAIRIEFGNVRDFVQTSEREAPDVNSSV